MTPLELTIGGEDDHRGLVLRTRGTVPPSAVHLQRLCECGRCVFAEAGPGIGVREPFLDDMVSCGHSGTERRFIILVEDSRLGEIANVISEKPTQTMAKAYEGTHISPQPSRYHSSCE